MSRQPDRRVRRPSPGYAWLDPIKLWILASCLGCAFYVCPAISQQEPELWFNAALLAASAIVTAVLRAIF